jgi:lipid II:glycine glycyltransferase (peptidoglycan interpeptide bridge formation enzyme)
VPGVTSRRMQVESVDLREGFDHLFAHSFTSSARRNVRKAERVGVTVERDTTGRLVPQLYELYLDWTADRAEHSGLPLWAAATLARRREPLQMFQTLAEAVGDACRVWVARHDGEPIAGAMTFVHGAQAVYFRGYSKVAKTRRVYANNLIQSLAMQDACEAGCTSYSMGYSGGVPGLEDFKRSMGATPSWALECRIDRIHLSRAEQLSDRARNTAAQAVRRLRGSPAEP